MVILEPDGSLTTQAGGRGEAPSPGTSGHIVPELLVFDDAAGEQSLAYSFDVPGVGRVAIGIRSVGTPGESRLPHPTGRRR